MELITSICVFIFGSIIGSFLNVCIYRIPREESIAFPPSHCGNCNTSLKALDLIPIFSWLGLRGKCRYCGEKVSIQYPLVEVLTGFLFLGVFLKFGFTLDTVKYIMLTAILIVIAIIDFKTEDIYTNTIIFGIIFGIIFIVLEYFINPSVNPLTYILGAVGGALILALIVWLTNAMGWGDVELVFFIGLFIGFRLSMLNIFLSIVIGGLVALALMITKKKNRGDSMAFGPYIAISTYIIVLVGNDILNWYLNSFF